MTSAMNSVQCRHIVVLALLLIVAILISERSKPENVSTSGREAFVKEEPRNGRNEGNEGNERNASTAVIHCARQSASFLSYLKRLDAMRIVSNATVRSVQFYLEHSIKRGPAQASPPASSTHTPS